MPRRSRFIAVNDSIDKAKASWSKHDAPSTVKHLEDALFAARKEAPLEIRAALAVDEMFGLGVYKPAQDGRLKNRELNLYVEIANLRYEPIDDRNAAQGAAQGNARDVARASAPATDRYRVRLELEGTFFNVSDTRKQLGKPRKLGEQVYETRAPIGVAWLGVPLALGDDFPAGNYELELKVRDVAGSKSATKTVSFAVV